MLLMTAWMAQADPILTSWFTQNSSVLARVIQGNGTPLPTTAVTTWPSAGVVNNNTGSASQSVPAYADIQRIRYTTTDVYINSSGLASYIMGPWYGNTNKTSPWGFWPLARDYSNRITREPEIELLTKTKHPGGMIGMMVNGVAIYDLGDAFSFNQTANSPVTGSDSTAGAGYWSRDALAVEVVTFDQGFAHQPGINGQYHYHAEPKALRYQLGDNMKATYNATTNLNTYTEIDPTGTTTPLHHSPILGWCFDGYPIYGPYGYTSANNSSSSITRMRRGFVYRDGSYGTANLTITGRTTLPKWATIAQGYRSIENYKNTANLTVLGDYPLSASQYGPATTYTTTAGPNTTRYTLGRYTGDYDFLGDNGYTQGVDFDLDQYNGRICVTPEYPSGTYAYFVTIDTSGNTVFPHLLGKEYYGKSNSANNAIVPSVATELFNGGPNTSLTVSGHPAVNSTNGNVTLVWNSVEGGTYKVEASSNLTDWTVIVASVAAASNASTTSLIESVAALPANHPKRFYRVARTSIAAYDPAYVGQ